MALISGSNEFEQGLWKVKELAKKEEQTVPEADVIATINRILV